MIEDQQDPQSASGSLTVMPQARQRGGSTPSTMARPSQRKCAGRVADSCIGAHHRRSEQHVNSNDPNGSTVSAAVQPLKLLDYIAVEREVNGFSVLRNWEIQMKRLVQQLRLLLILGSVLVLPVQAALGESDAEMVRQAVKAFAETWNLHDMTAFGALFASDADFVNVTGQWWKGREQIQLRRAFLHGAVSPEAVPEALPRNQGIFKRSNYSFDEIDIKLISPEIAIAHGKWTMTHDARTDEPRHGMMTFVLRRVGDHWPYVAVQNSEINRRVN